MPFVQRAVSPIFLSRSRSPTAAISLDVPQSKSQARITLRNASISDPINRELPSAGEKGRRSHQNSTSIFQNFDFVNYPFENICYEHVFEKSAVNSAKSTAIINDYEFEFVSNITLSNVLRQLASLLLMANDIFVELNNGLKSINDYSQGIKQRIDTLEIKVQEFDPKLVTVPESDLQTFVHIPNHFVSKHHIDMKLFTSESRSTNLQIMYDRIVKTPISNIREILTVLNNNQQDQIESDLFCTPVFGQTHRKMCTRIDIDIETRMPTAVEELRRWTSSEALGDITVTPDCISRIGYANSSNISTICNNSQNHNFMATCSQTFISIMDKNITDSTNEEIDLPLNHRLPSPEEQCQIIAMKFPAELVTVDTTGKRFERMCFSRKSTNNLGLEDKNNLNADVHTLNRRSRSRKIQRKRRNTIVGTDQTEIEKAAEREIISTVPPNDVVVDNSTKVLRSKSNEILKKESVHVDIGKATLTRFNSLKQWGRNRFKSINRNDDKKLKAKSKEKLADLDVEGKKNFEKEEQLSHERKPSYSSSEKSLNAQSKVDIKHPLRIVTPVKLRESSSIKRQRRNIFGQQEEPHSSSGNWSASSESGRTSIGSEITIQPKSTASSTSLNHINLFSGSGPPSSVISRRRFLNTSCSSSVTSDGTTTPDLQIHDFDDETSSAYSCDTEGYYTSFHVDSGLKTLKEEEPMTPLHSTSALSSNNSFGSSINQTISAAENEYELFGKGSTSTTASSAGTVCTTLMVAESYKNLLNGPAVPERKSSLTKLNRSMSNINIERNFSTGSVVNTMERIGAPKRKGILVHGEVSVIVHKGKFEQQNNNKSLKIDFDNKNSSPIENNYSPRQGLRNNSEYEYSECSDLEGVDRIERIRIKTEINSSRIPSICIITPTTSDDETLVKEREDLKSPQYPSMKTDAALDSIKCDEEDNINDKNCTNVSIVKSVSLQNNRKDKNFNNFKRTTLQPLNIMLDKLKGVIPNLKKLPSKEINEPTYDTNGEYVTITDVRNKNNLKKINKGIYYSNDTAKNNLATVLSGNLYEDTEYVSLNELPCSVRCDGNNLLPLNYDHASTMEKTNMNLKKMVYEKETITSNIQGASSLLKDNHIENVNTIKSHETPEYMKNARVTIDAQGKIIHNSDSLKRGRGGHTTFLPGPHVKSSSVKLTENDSIPKIYPTNKNIPGLSLTSDSNLSSSQEFQQKLSQQQITGDVLKYSTIKENKLSTLSQNQQLLDKDFQEVPAVGKNQMANIFQNPVVSASSLHQMDCTLSGSQQNLSNKAIMEAKYESNIRTDDNNLEPTYAIPNKIKDNMKSTSLDLLSQQNRDDEIDSNELNLTDQKKTEHILTSTPIKSSFSMFKVSLSDYFGSRMGLNENVRSATTSPNSSGRSTPSKGLFEQQSKFQKSGRSNNNNTVQTCSDRLGTPKTSLNDFKKLLLATSTKNSSGYKPSAVELLKLNKKDETLATTISNSRSNILQLKGSPRTYRRSFKHVGYSSPSKSLAKRGSNNGWRMNVSRTDVISISIPEGNSEEDTSSSNSSLGHQSSGQISSFKRSTTSVPVLSQSPISSEKSVISEKVDLRKNIFLQAEENNFMKGEIPFKTSRSQLNQRSSFISMGSNSNNKLLLIDDGLKKDVEPTLFNTLEKRLGNEVCLKNNSSNENSLETSL